MTPEETIKLITEMALSVEWKENGSEVWVICRRYPNGNYCCFHGYEFVKSSRMEALCTATEKCYTSYKKGAFHGNQYQEE